ncbi:MAG: hypothetical protein AB8A40_06885 [Prochlorococcus sp.]|mgnify:FL=1|jgi:membrane protein DedA with SNARE-associated domain|nr:hypothetical protein [Prochlorococcaceae cyanobacterium ETNP14_MAG_4]
MTTPTTEQLWKQWLDRLLMLDAFLVIAGALWFVVAILAGSQGVQTPMRLLEQLWEPLFTPAIGLLIAAALFNGVWAWWQRIRPVRDQDTES